MKEEIRIIRSNRKTVSLTVTKDGEVVLRAPLRAGEAFLTAFLKKHEGWIEARKRALSLAPKLDLSDGGILVLFGARYPIKTGRPRILSGAVFLPEEGREEALVRLIKKFSLRVMEELTSAIALKYGFTFRSVRISSARGRWGSCNREGKIAYTFRVAFLPPALCEYVVVHELAHTVVFDHSPAFWREVERVLPDWKTRRRALKQSRVMDFL